MVRGRKSVSVLFSEPKIPQSNRSAGARMLRTRFQCSSASRKFLNGSIEVNNNRVTASFSALQRAENSSMTRSAPSSPRSVAVSVLFSEPKIPQCWFCPYRSARSQGFSALQRAENSSIPGARPNSIGLHFVSVLFSEPKIPQSATESARGRGRGSFSALQRAENSSMKAEAIQRLTGQRFSALQRAENSSMLQHMLSSISSMLRFSALQRAENSSISSIAIAAEAGFQFQCSSASRKFLNFAAHCVVPMPALVSVLFSEPKIPQSSARRSSARAA